MECPECKGFKQIKLPDPYVWMPCPTCKGEGQIPDEPAINWCPACGEPIPDSDEWCDFHAAAAWVGKSASSE